MLKDNWEKNQLEIYKKEKLKLTELPRQISGLTYRC
jgi:hypothetical protein